MIHLHSPKRLSAPYQIPEIPIPLPSLFVLLGATDSVRTHLKNLHRITTFHHTDGVAGGEGAPDVTESLQNLGINGLAVAVLGWLVARDLKGREQDEIVVAREESLARLQVAPCLVLCPLRLIKPPTWVAAYRALVATHLGCTLSFLNPDDTNAHL